MDLSLKVWVYLKPEQQIEGCSRLAEFLNLFVKDRLKHDAEWVATPVSGSDSKKATASMETPAEAKQAAKSSPDGEAVFTSLVVSHIIR